MRSRSCARLFLSAVLLAAGSGLTLSAQTPASQETTPLIGTWILNLAKSTYEGMPAPKSETRTFDLHGDGMILCTYSTENARGTRTFGHWLTDLNGKEAPEYVRSSGGKPVAFVAHTMPDPYTMDTGVSRDGKVDQSGRWIVSKDGKTLTQTISGTNAQGQPTRRVRVYDKQ